MAIKIVKNPPPLFQMKCEKCDCVFTYELEDLYRSITTDYIRCPHCREEIPHYLREAQ